MRKLVTAMVVLLAGCAASPPPAPVVPQQMKTVPFLPVWQKVIEYGPEVLV